MRRPLSSRKPSGLLRFLGKVDAGSAPPSYTEARSKAVAEAARYSAAHGLDPRGATILEYAVHSAALSGFVDPTWNGETLSAGLAELATYRAKVAVSGPDPIQTVTILDKAEWRAGWFNEPRLAILFEPDLGHSSPDGETLSNTRRLSATFAAPRLVFTDGAAYPPTNPSSVEDQLFNVAFRSRREPFLWKGSEVDVTESNGPLQYSMTTFSSHTAVSATGLLAAATYDFLCQVLEAHRPGPDSPERLWLTIGFPFDGAIPRGRPVDPDDTVADPVRLHHQAHRLWLRLDRVAADPEVPDARRTELIGQWMAAE